MENLQTMFDLLPVMIRGIMDFVQWCMDFTVAEALTSVAAVFSAVNPVGSVTTLPILAALTGLAATNPNIAAALDVPLFVAMFGAGFMLYATGSLVRWILDLFT